MKNKILIAVGFSFFLGYVFCILVTENIVEKHTEVIIDVITIDAGNIEQVHRFFNGSPEPDSAVILDFSKVECISTAFVRELEQLSTQYEKDHVRWMLVTSEPVRRILCLSAPIELPIVPTLAEALQRVRLVPIAQRTLRRTWPNPATRC